MANEKKTGRGLPLPTPISYGERWLLEAEVHRANKQNMQDETVTRRNEVNLPDVAGTFATAAVKQVVGFGVVACKQATTKTKITFTADLVTTSTSTSECVIISYDYCTEHIE